MALSVEKELSVLIVESEAELGDLVDLHLRQAGFRTRRARSGGKAVAASVADPPDALVLDVELPDVGGLDVCRMPRAQPATEEMPILLLSGRSGETDRLAGLEAGADEYLVKPVSVRELVLRIGRLHKRRSGAAPANGTLRAGPFRIDTDGYLAYVDGKAACGFSTPMFFIVREEAAVDRCRGSEISHLTLSPTLILLAFGLDDVRRRDERLDALADAHEDAVVDDADDDRRRRRRVPGGNSLRMRRPRIVEELLDAEGDLLLVVVDREDDRLDVVALVVEVGRVVDAHASTRGRSCGPCRRRPLRCRRRRRSR